MTQTIATMPAPGKIAIMRPNTTETMPAMASSHALLPITWRNDLADLEAGRSMDAKPVCTRGSGWRNPRCMRKSQSPVVPLAASVEIRGMALNGNDRSVTFKGVEATSTRQERDLVSILVDHPT